MKKIPIYLIIILILASILRLWGLNKVPVSLFGDEVDVGYQAYSIFKTGRDYYGNFLPIHLHSLAEWRTPGYLYSAVPTIAIFGINAWGVRLPASIFGILGVLMMYLLVKEIFKNEKLALISAFVLTISPWHLQYSRAGFEVTELLFFFLTGLYLFFKGLKQPKWLWVSIVCLSFLPWIYSTAKLFNPLLFLFLIIIWGKDLLKLPRKYLLFSFLAFLIVTGPIAINTLTSGGTERFGYISIFTDPTTESEVGTARGIDALARKEVGTGLTPKLIDKVFHNKFVFWGSKVINNFLQPFSADFLFNNGDPNPRHSIENMGEFYKIEAIPLISGMILFFTAKSEDKKKKLLIAFLVFAGVVPAAITRDGGNHATRLILILPAFVFLISYGIVKVINLFSKQKFLVVFGYFAIILISFLFYQHNYWIHNPYQSERWWHAGFMEAVKKVKEIDKDYEKVVISTASEPPWIFFAGFYEYDPVSWQKNFPIGRDVDLAGFGKVSHIDKFYFGSPSKGGVYDWGQTLDKKTLYLASSKEVNVNLVLEPERLPKDLKLIQSFKYPSGEPAFYLFTGIK